MRGFVVESFAVSRAAELEQVVVALDVLREQHHVKGGLAVNRLAFPAVAGSHVRFHADQRLDAFLLALVVEFDDAEHAAVVGDRQRIHAERLGPFHEVRNAAGAVEERVMRVNVQVGKRHKRIGLQDADECPRRPT